LTYIGFIYLAETSDLLLISKIFAFYKGLYWIFITQFVLFILFKIPSIFSQMNKKIEITKMMGKPDKKGAIYPPENIKIYEILFTEFPSKKHTD